MTVYSLYLLRFQKSEKSGKKRQLRKNQINGNGKNSVLVKSQKSKLDL